MLVLKIKSSVKNFFIYCSYKKLSDLIEASFMPRNGDEKLNDIK